MFRKRKKKEEFEPARPVDRSRAMTATYYPNTNQYHGRKCLFHGGEAVSVCPNCGTLFCMDCVGHLDACPRCRTPVNFVDGSQQAAAVDDRELIETEAQRKAIQQRWAMKRLAEADAQVKDKDRRTVMPDQDIMVEKLMRDTDRYMAPRAQDAPPQAYQAAVQKVEAEQSMDQSELSPEELPPERSAPTNKKAEEKKEKLREILDQETENQESRDLSRL